MGCWTTCECLITLVSLHDAQGSFSDVGYMGVYGTIPPSMGSLTSLTYLKQIILLFLLTSVRLS